MKRRVHTVDEALSEQVIQTEAAQTEATRLQSELTRAETDLGVLQSRLDSLSTRRPSSQNPLVQIQGIGQVFSQRLNAAGIYTFAELAAQSPDAVRAIIGTTRGGAMADPEAWIAEAKQRANPS
jgi:predicted flap endonuclease-1-like 5' DNA nuclease